MSVSYDLQEALRQLEGSLDPGAVAALAAAAGTGPREVEIAALRLGLAPERYQRNLGTVGREGQLALLGAVVAVVGLGGLGGFILELLARMGVGRILAVDSDRFEAGNLNRQLLATAGTLGRPKAEIAAERVREVNPAVAVTVRAARLDGDNAPTLLAGAGVVVDALDTLPARYLLQAACAGLGVPLVHGAIAGWWGQVLTIFPGDPGLEALYGEASRVPERGVETALGNPAATPAMVAAWQVQEVVKLVTGRGRPLRHRLLWLDAEQGEVGVLRLPGGEAAGGGR